MEALLNLDQATDVTAQSRRKQIAPDEPPGVLHAKQLLASNSGFLKSPVVTVCP